MTDILDLSDTDPREIFSRQMSMLGALADAGFEIAMEIKARALAEDGDPNAAAIAFARVSRAVRLTLMLQERVLKTRAAYDKGQLREATHAAEQHKRARKRQLENIIERIADRQDDPDRDEARPDVREQLDQEDLYDFDRPLPELIARICDDLGLAPDWPVLMDEAWAQPNMRDLPPLPPRPPCGDEKSSDSEPVLSALAVHSPDWQRPP